MKPGQYNQAIRVSDTVIRQEPKNRHDLRAFGGLLNRCKSAVFHKTERESTVFSTETEKDGFTGFFGIGREIGRGKRA